MKEFCKETVQKLEATITELENEFDCPTQRIEAIIKTILQTLNETKEFVLKRGFKNKEEEIYFFKTLKPIIVSKLIYYNAIFKIETKKPMENTAIKKYLKAELKKLEKYFDNNLDFYKYYRTGNSSLDERLFLREKHDIKLCLDTHYFQADHNFSTSHDYKVAKVMANDLIKSYIEEQLRNANNAKPYDLYKLQWTGSKTALTELIYALYSQGVFNNGSSDIREIAKYFESVFNTDLGNVYQTFLELRSRKMNRTKFVDALREGLIKKMDEQDEK